MKKILVFLLLILFSFGFKIYENKKINIVRIGYYFDDMSIESIDPADIKFFEPAQILNNIYSRLVEYDENGNIQVGASSKFYTRNNYLIFEFSNKSKTLSDHYIDAYDALYSLKRLIILKTGKHSSIELLLGIKKTEKDLDVHWDELFVRDNKLYIKFKDKINLKYILVGLASGDCAIIPKNAINKKSLKIENFKETSGPYYLANIEKNSNSEIWTLHLNKQHYAILESSPVIVELIDKKKPTAFDLLNRNEIDIIPTSIPINEKYLKEINSIEKLKINSTFNIRLNMLSFGNSGFKKLSRAQRMYVATQFNKAYGTLPKYYGAKNTIKFYQDQAFGDLNKSQFEEIKKLNENMNSKVTLKGLSFNHNHYFQNKLGNKILNYLPGIKLVTKDNNNLTKFDIRMIETDSGFAENITFIYYSMKMGTFKELNINPDKWIHKYLTLSTDKERLELVNQLHFISLKKGIFFPMFSSPYTTVGRNGYELPVSSLYASSYFWKIRKTNNI